jgi:SAM-dependent methyltransferase
MNAEARMPSDESRSHETIRSSSFGIGHSLVIRNQSLRIALPLLFAVTVFVNAALLFGVEPMIAKMILPKLGGTPAVWNTCLVFFQAVLLAGYAAAHGLTRWLGLRPQVVLTLVLQGLVFLVLPIHIAAPFMRSVPHESHPIPWLLGLLLAMAGLPFFVLAATGPLLQKWFAGTNHPAAADPYFLYGASNLGSMLALLSYPCLVEPKFRLEEQTSWWAVGFGLLLVLTLGCGFWSPRSPAVSVGGYSPPPSGPGEPERLAIRRRAKWVALAFVPSSLMLGVTTYLSTDIATIPLLWVIPLALYLLTFILAFARWQLIPHRLMRRTLPLGILLLTICLLSEDMQPPIWLLIPLHLLTFFGAGLFCHGELARDRPGPAHLTEFYLWLAVGGVLGGLFNALVAPLVFNRIVEYPLALVLLCLLRPGPPKARLGRWSRWLDWGLPLALGGLTAGLIVRLPSQSLEPLQLRLGLMFGLPAVLCYTFVDRPRRFALGVTALLVAGLLYTGAHGRPLYTERSFFGVLRVTLDPTGTFRQLVHGNTVHGRQRIDEEGPPVPRSYYHRDGPIGRLFAVLPRMNPQFAEARIGVVGLGVGSLAAYAEPGQQWTFYEIDPAVKRLASNPAYFTFLQKCRAEKLDVVLGDARLRLEDAPEHHYDLFILDAFSSDAVPVHLLTREAMRLYRDKLAPGGLLAFHISNRYLDLKPVLGNLAADAEWSCRVREDLGGVDKDSGKDPSVWVVMANSKNALEPLSKALWEPLPGHPGVEVWKDDFSNLLGIFKWQEWGGD